MYTSCIIYIDVIKLVTLCRIKPRAKYGWKYRNYGYFKNIKIGFCSVKLSFIPKSGAEEGEFRLGNLYIEFSAPKFFEETNESGLPLEDLDAVYDNLIEALDYYHILPPLNTEGWSQTSFEITKLESSITLYFNSQEEVDEHLRLFRMRYFPFHKPNMLNRKEQDYDTTVYHGTKSEDIVLYDKKKETKEHNPWDSDDSDDDSNHVYMLRLEFRRKKSRRICRETVLEHSLILPAKTNICFAESEDSDWICQIFQRMNILNYSMNYLKFHELLKRSEKASENIASTLMNTVKIKPRKKVVTNITNV